MSEQMPLKTLSSVKLALMARDARIKAGPILRADPIAVVGMACRVPGAGSSVEEFWELLRDGRDAIRDIPADRWNSDEWFATDLAAPAKAVTKSGGFLDQIDGFDADYFGILPREAERMDPQQRLFLEVAIEALDDAGLPHKDLRGSRTGVFVASYHNDYAQLQYADPETIDPRTLTGTLHSVLVNRLSYLLDLHGPSMSIDTACSSSLVAVHLACQSLRLGESDVAIAGGVSLMVAPELMVAMSKVGFMSPDGRSKAFDAQADGFGRGEGCAVIVLKRLSDAIADNDRILAVVRGSAVNQDGHSTLLAAPNGLAQERLIREALLNAQLEPWRVSYVEAHGTGTALGDPIEVEAIAATFGKPHAEAGLCRLGSVKANIGHLEAAAGVIGMVKAMLALRHDAIPPQVHFTKLSPHISLAGTRLEVPTRLIEWPAGPTPRCAAVSSFGVGGTNAHVIVEEAPTISVPYSSHPDAPYVLPISAKSRSALEEMADSWETFLTRSDSTAVDLCYTAANRRSHHDHRLAVVGRSKEELAARLRDRLLPGAVRERSALVPPRIAFVFSGQGPQWYGMGRELLAREKIFSDVVHECDALLRSLSGWSLLEELSRPQDQSRLDHTEIAQPALFALQAGIAALWKSWGVSPDAVVGHSVGEIAALHVAGALDIAEAIRVVWHRGRIMQRASSLGRMAAVELSESEANTLLVAHRSSISLAAVNAPRRVVFSGQPEALKEVLAELTERGIGHTMLPVQYAFHSAQMAPLQKQLVETLGQYRLSSLRSPFTPL